MEAAQSIEQKTETQVGSLLRSIRTAKGYSLRGLADACGVTASALSQIENGKNSPSVSTLKKILAALGTTLGEFFARGDEATKSSFVYRAESLVNVAADSKLNYLSLPGASTGRAIQIIDERYEVGADTGPELYSHAGEECGICIAGRIELTVNGTREVLGPGDAFYFSSALPHRWRNVGEGPARMIAANTPPTF
jgi:transcriptional regulator with XRE-family HTH domain